MNSSVVHQLKSFFQPVNWSAVKKYKHYIIVVMLPMLCVIAIFVTLMISAGTITKINAQIEKNNTIISKNMDVMVKVERMLANHRGYLLTNNKELRQKYENNKGDVSDTLADLNTLMAGDPSQTSRLHEMQYYFLTFVQKLDDQVPGTRKVEVQLPVKKRPFFGSTGQPIKKSTITTTMPPPESKTLSVDQVRDNIARINNDILLEEHATLGKRLKALDNRRMLTRRTIGVLSCLALLLFMGFNYYLFRYRLTLITDGAEPTLGEAEDVFRLAIEGSSDGIFEWNLEKDKAFYSAQFWNMLGYEPGYFPDTMQSFRDLLHFEDRERVMAHIDHYLSGGTSEYLVIFRLKHKTGRWVWINARGKALYDEKGQPYKIVGAHTDISHIKAYEEKLEKAKETAEKANRAKTDFLAHMSHEIRTPLTAISGIAEIFDISKDAFNEKQQNLIRALNSSTSSLKDLVSDILDFSKIESGELELEEKSFGLKDLFEQVMNIVSVKADEKKQKFFFYYEDVKNQKFLGDRARLRQILINLIGNAIKFTNENGVVEVVAKNVTYDGSPFLSIDVKDTGIGIDPANFEMIFERFKQADSSVSRKYGGTGLGLPISMRLARLMGGNIMVDSTLGQGSTFTLVVPFRTDEVQQPEENDRTINTALTENIRQQDFNHKNILLVEDYEGNIVLLSYLLDSMNCNYDVARDGIEALNLWRTKPYDLILMDIQMPEMDGFTATEQIRKTEKETGLPHTPIIGMTAHALIGDKEKCIEAGMDAYLPKPIVENDLKAKIVEYLTQKKRVA